MYNHITIIVDLSNQYMYLEASETVTDLQSAVDSTLVSANTTDEPKRETDCG